MIHLLFAIHNHQPVGNFDFVFEKAFDQAYAPFLDNLEAHPNISLSLHFSGILLTWLEEHKPAYLKKLKSLVKRGQVEILGGGFYEPILPIISDADKLGQLKKLQAAVKRLFGVTPKGIWLAERVWEPSLVKVIAEAGIEYVLLDGSHFKMAGKHENEMDGYFISEDQGYTLKMFPIHDVVRDFIPFRPVGDVIQTLHAMNTKEHVQVVFGDDGEKFGDWPFTNQLCYGEKWLHHFFEAIEQSNGAIRMETVARGLSPEKNLGLVYIPPASYQEMMIWAQNAKDIPVFRQAQRDLMQSEQSQHYLPFVKGVFWRNFFSKYAESNQMHKQVQRLNRALQKIKPELSETEFAEAQDHIWQAQCNCAYWHGVFGGLYLPHLRFALYRQMIEAQKIIDSKNSASKIAGPFGVWESEDWNCDGKLEFALNTPELYVSLNGQAEMDQLWLKKTKVNLIDTLTRRFEAYHDNIAGKPEDGTKLENTLGSKEENLQQYLIYDKGTRRSSADHCLQAQCSPETYFAQQYHEAYKLVWKTPVLTQTKKSWCAEYMGEGLVEASHIAFQVKKTMIFSAQGLKVQWSFSGLESVNFRLVSENLFCLLAGNASDRFVEWKNKNATQPERDRLASHGSMETTEVLIRDEWLRLQGCIKADTCEFWRDAIETVSQSEGGYERVYQGTVLIPVWDIELTAGQEKKCAMELIWKEGI